MIDTKICVVGLGGVGGYVGGMLALHLNHVSFYARGARLESIQKKGLSVCSHSHGNFTAYPKIVSDQAKDIGYVDYVILAVKHFSLEKVISDILPMIGENTVVLPLLNGVGNADKVKKLLPKGRVFDGLIYIVSYSAEDFTVQHTSPYGRIHFGLTHADSKDKLQLKELKSLLDSAQISNKIEDDIDAAV